MEGRGSSPQEAFTSQGDAPVTFLERLTNRIERLNDRHARADRPCVYGHIDCAIAERGQCLGEALTEAEAIYKRLTGEAYDH
jgi:hypothetical protein